MNLAPLKYTVIHHKNFKCFLRLVCCSWLFRIYLFMLFCFKKFCLTSIFIVLVLLLLHSSLRILANIEETKSILSCRCAVDLKYYLICRSISVYFWWFFHGISN